MNAETFLSEHIMRKIHRVVFAIVSTLGLFPALALAQERQERPYFVTYDHYLLNTGELELSNSPIWGEAPDIHSFVGNWSEAEYGVRKWWTTAFYVDWQHTQHEGSLFTGVRFENRFRPWLEEHRINPVLYVEYEHLNGGDKTLREIVGFEGKQELREPNSVVRHEQEREMETKLILSSDIGEWNLSENFIGSKNIHGEPWEFGYAVGASRRLATWTGKRCAFCAERFRAGVELYGGLGEWGDFTVHGTSQYIAPVIEWNLPSETSLRVSPGWGLTDNSVRTIFRIGVSKEFDDVGHWFGKLFSRH